jgi:muramoyltetrapeptide carboxypeptidase LdcA involved in peptidoglycan recycling
MDHETLAEIVCAKPELAHMPVVADASFGHTTPQFTLPIGGAGTLRAAGGEVRLVVRDH